MAIIDEKMAWNILKKYVIDCLKIDNKSLIAIYAIGSLPAGYYRPGQSDIDAVLIVSDGSEEIWGDCAHTGKNLAALNRKYKREYNIPKDFGPFPIQPRDFIPPYDPIKESTLEIARLKIQGKPVYGSYPVEDIPMPVRADFLKDFRHFEDYMENIFPGERPADQLTVTECVNIILMYLNRYLIMERGIIQFDKRKTIPLYREYEAPFSNPEVFDIISEYLVSGNTPENKFNILQEYAMWIRGNMITLLHLY